MRFVLLLLGLFVVPAMAADRPWQSREVPDPIPPDFNECVVLVSTEKGIAHGFKGRVARWHPPLTREDHALLSYYRREGWGILKLCDNEQT